MTADEVTSIFNFVLIAQNHLIRSGEFDDDDHLQSGLDLWVIWTHFHDI